MNRNNLINIFNAQYGKPDLSFSLKDDCGSVDIFCLHPISEEDLNVTSIFTLGLSTLGSNNEKFELVFDVFGEIPEAECLKLGYALKSLGEYFLSDDMKIEPYTTIEKPDILLSVYQRYSYLLVTDWIYDGPKFLDSEQTIRILEIVPIFEEEAKEFNLVPDTEKELLFQQSKGDWNNSQRDLVHFYGFAVKNIWDRIEKWHVENGIHFDKPFEGLSKGKILELEKLIGVKLPTDFKRSMSLYNGGTFFDSYKSLTFNEILTTYQMMKDIQKEGKFDHLPKNPTENIVQNIWWSKYWIPFAEDSGGNLLCLDMNPDEKGKVGQIIYWEKAEGPIYACSSFLVWLNYFKTQLISGKLSRI